MFDHHVTSTVNYIAHLIRYNSKNQFVPQVQVQIFRNHLLQLLSFKLKKETLPIYIHMCRHRIDPILLAASQLCNWSNSYLRTILPRNFTIWIHPHEIYVQFNRSSAIYIIYEHTTDTVPFDDNTSHLINNKMINNPASIYDLEKSINCLTI